MRRATSVLPLLALAIAGCAAPASVAPLAIGESSPSVEALEPLVLELKVGSTLSLPFDDVGAEDAAFEVPPGYAALEAVAEWSCASSVCGYSIILWREGERVAREAEERTLRANVEEGSYVLGLRSTGPGAGMEGALTVTLSPGPI